jgi:thiol-disulfide isomerase/thioredoxin
MNAFYIILVIVFLAILSWYIYKKYFVTDNTKFIPNNEYSPNDRITCTVTLYYTTWCPHCKIMIPEWTEYIANYKNDKYEPIFTEVDCDLNPGDASDIEEYPTIVLIRNNKKFFYDSQFTPETMDKFINTIMDLPPPK